MGSVNIEQLPEYIKRMIQEHEEVKGRVIRCAKFIESEEYKKLNNISKSLLVTQLSAMQTYSNILSLRLNHEVAMTQQPKES